MLRHCHTACRLHKLTMPGFIHAMNHFGDAWVAPQTHTYLAGILFACRLLLCAARIRYDLEDLS